MAMLDFPWIQQWSSKAWLCLKLSMANPYGPDEFVTSVNENLLKGLDGIVAKQVQYILE